MRGLICRGVDCLSTYDFATFKWLRVLDLSEGKFSEPPESIGDLVLFKYINLSGAKVLKLPDSITKFRELRTLGLSGSDIKSLPNKISKLGALRHLDISGILTLLNNLPNEIGKLTSKFIVSRMTNKAGKEAVYRSYESLTI